MINSLSFCSDLVCKLQILQFKWWMSAPRAYFCYYSPFVMVQRQPLPLRWWFHCKHIFIYDWANKNIVGTFQFKETNREWKINKMDILLTIVNVVDFSLSRYMHYGLGFVTYFEQCTRKQLSIIAQKRQQQQLWYQ